MQQAGHKSIFKNKIHNDYTTSETEVTSQPNIESNANLDARSKHGTQIGFENKYVMPRLRATWCNNWSPFNIN
jgi:hypothetical protein